MQNLAEIGTYGGTCVVFCTCHVQSDNATLAFTSPSPEALAQEMRRNVSSSRSPIGESLNKVPNPPVPAQTTKRSELLDELSVTCCPGV